VGHTLLNKLGVKKCAHIKRFNRFAGCLASPARFDLCRRRRRRVVEPFMWLPLWSPSVHLILNYFNQISAQWLQVH